MDKIPNTARISCLDVKRLPDIFLLEELDSVARIIWLTK